MSTNPNKDIIDIFKNFQKYYLKHNNIKNKAYGRIVSALEKVKFKNYKWFAGQRFTWYWESCS